MVALIGLGLVFAEQIANEQTDRASRPTVCSDGTAEGSEAEVPTRQTLAG